jgi:hypoxanthine phosphoribosyltransferase
MKNLDITYNEYKGLVANICRGIAQSNWKPHYIAGITRGGLLPAVMISHYFSVPCHTLKVNLRDHNDDDCESNLWMAEDAFGAVSLDAQSTYMSRWDISKRKNILIVDDINDSGNTLNWIVNDWQSGCFPTQEYAWLSVWNHNVKFASIVNNLSSQFKHNVDFYGLEINKSEDDVWVTFPYENWWSNSQ